MLIKLVNDYIDLAFSNKNIQNLYFHPIALWKNYWTTEIYYFAIKNHKLKDKIKVISFFIILSIILEKVIYFHIQQIHII